jgi:hypothetical protein
MITCRHGTCPSSTKRIYSLNKGSQTSTHDCGMRPSQLINNCHVSKKPVASTFKEASEEWSSPTMKLETATSSKPDNHLPNVTAPHPRRVDLSIYNPHPTFNQMCNYQPAANERCGLIYNIFSKLLCLQENYECGTTYIRSNISGKYE